jgi:hypothetical protein
VDGDGDGITYIWRWFIDDVEDPTITSGVLPGAQVLAGRRYACEVRASDGAEAGPVAAREVFLGATAALPAQLLASDMASHPITSTFNDDVTPDVAWPHILTYPDGSQVLFQEAQWSTWVPGTCWTEQGSDTYLSTLVNDAGSLTVQGAVLDFDGDGRLDVLVGNYRQDLGALSQAGVAGIFLGSSGLPTASGVSASDADIVLRGTIDGGGLGRRWYVGDFNGDGQDDALVASADGVESRAWVVYGSSLAPGEYDIDQVGWPLAPEATGSNTDGKLAVGDWNGDGYDDVFGRTAANEQAVWNGGPVGTLSEAPSRVLARADANFLSHAHYPRWVRLRQCDGRS